MPSNRAQRLRRLLPHRNDRLKTRELEEMFELVEYMRLYFFEELEQRKKEEKEKEEKNKPKESMFVKKFTFGQVVMGAWLASLALFPLYLKVLWPFLH